MNTLDGAYMNELYHAGGVYTSSLGTDESLEYQRPIEDRGPP